MSTPCLQHLAYRYFRHAKWTSLLRQLNLYGFRRLTRGVDCGGYYHECFLKGHPSLCQRIHRIPVKGTGIRGHSGAEPNLYAHPPAVYASDCDAPVGSNATEDNSKQISKGDLVTSEVVHCDYKISNEVMTLQRSVLEAIIDDLLADLDPVDCVMIDDFCSDWMSTFI
jgi:HSF-type DNA-binding